MRTLYLALLVVGLVLGCSSSDDKTGQATSGTCDPGGACACTGDGSCDKTCSGAGCALQCTGNGGCSISCPKGGCTVACNGAGGCAIHDCADCKCTAGTAGGACL
jgi:hypothetical protein